MIVSNGNLLHEWVKKGVESGATGDMDIDMFSPSHGHDILTFMLLVANLANAKWCKTPEKWLKPSHIDTPLSTQRELSNEYQHDRV